MEYTDEEIIKERRKLEAPVEQSIYEDEVLLGGQKLCFERMDLFDHEFSIMLPNDFIDMPPNLAKIKYPSEERPTVIKTSEDTKINFGFTLHDVAFFPSDVEKTSKGYYGLIKKLYPHGSFYNFKVYENNDVTIGTFSFKIAGIDTEIYQVFAFCSLSNKLLHFLFNAPFALVENWIPIVKQVIDSIEYRKES